MRRVGIFESENQFLSDFIFFVSTEKSFDEGLKALNGFLKNYNERIPPLINTYMKLSPTMKSFGTAVNPEFGGVEETGILVTTADIYPEKTERHLVF